MICAFLPSMKWSHCVNSAQWILTTYQKRSHFRSSRLNVSIVSLSEHVALSWWIWKWFKAETVPASRQLFNIDWLEWEQDGFVACDYTKHRLPWASEALNPHHYIYITQELNNNSLCITQLCVHYRLKCNPVMWLNCCNVSLEVIKSVRTASLWNIDWDGCKYGCRMGSGVCNNRREAAALIFCR